MSDGPHRSLPMRRHWKDFAERSAKAAFSSGEVSEALPHAIKKDILEAPIKEVREIMGGGTLFPEMRIEGLDALRQTHRGAAATHLIDCAIEAAANGLNGEPVLRSRLKTRSKARYATLSGESKNTMTVKQAPTARAMRTRLDAARQQFDCSALARELLSSETPPSRRSVSLPRHSGVDEGPPL